MSNAKFYILDGRGCVGNSAVWWRPKREGYTCDLRDAGRYTEEEARAQEQRRPTDLAIPCEQADALVEWHVHVDRLLDTKPREGDSAGNATEE